MIPHRYNFTTLPDLIGAIQKDNEGPHPYGERPIAVRWIAASDRRKMGGLCSCCGAPADWWVGRPTFHGNGILAVLCDECREPLDVIAAVEG